MTPTTPWHTSSRSGPSGGNCVEVRRHGGAVQIRDSKHPDGPVLTFTPDGWAAFVESVHLGEFDPTDRA